MRRVRRILRRLVAERHASHLRSKGTLAAPLFRRRTRPFSLIYSCLRETRNNRPIFGTAEI
jgi:hypothetical protein